MWIHVSDSLPDPGAGQEFIVSDGQCVYLATFVRRDDSCEWVRDSFKAERLSGIVYWHECPKVPSKHGLADRLVKKLQDNSDWEPIDNLEKVGFYWDSSRKKWCF